MGVTNERFAAHTRSASFALDLSDRQIQYVLTWAKLDELEAKYPWYTGQHYAAFTSATAEELAAEWCDGTVRALARKGLVDVLPAPPPCRRHDVIPLNAAGRLVASLLTEAGFECDPRWVLPVPLHPDDRAVINLDGGPDIAGADRRDPTDGPFLGSGTGGYRRARHDVIGGMA